MNEGVIAADVDGLHGGDTLPPPGGGREQASRTPKKAKEENACVQPASECRAEHQRGEQAVRSSAHARPDRAWEAPWPLGAWTPPQTPVAAAARA